MKKITLLLIAIASLFISCEDVISVDTGTMEPKLVVDASINWIKGTTGQYQIISLSTTTDYYNLVTPSVSGAVVEISNTNGDIFTFKEDTSIPGAYFCDNFNPKLKETYTLTVIYNNEIFTATEILYAAPDLLYTTQEEGGLLGNGEIVKAFFVDPPNEENFYMHLFSRAGKLPQTAVFDDSYVNGNETFTVRLFDELPKNDVIYIDLMGISERYFNYMSKIMTTVSEANAGPFEVAPAQLRGNIVNRTDQNNYAFGYFRLSEVSQIQHTAQ